MKGKNTFTKKEANEIKKLIKEKLVSDEEQQKIIRNRIRALGFYMTDFSTKKKYNVQDFEEAVTIVE
jgi:CTP:phosphocholine cytidylyltransferase-like protein